MSLILLVTCDYVITIYIVIYHYSLNAADNTFTLLYIIILTNNDKCSNYSSWIVTQSHVLSRQDDQPRWLRDRVSPWDWEVIDLTPCLIQQ